MATIMCQECGTIIQLGEWYEDVESKKIAELRSTIAHQAGLIRQLKETSKDYWTYMQHRKGCASIIKQVHKRGECNCGFFELNNKFTALMNELEKREG